MGEPLCFFPEGRPERRDRAPCYATTSKQRCRARAAQRQPAPRACHSAGVLPIQPGTIPTLSLTLAPKQGVPQDPPRGRTAAARSRARALLVIAPAVTCPASGAVES